MPPDIPFSTTLTDDRILLRAIVEDDIDQIYDAIIESRDHLTRFMAWCKADYGRADTEAFVRTQPQAWLEGREYPFLILERDSRKLLGSCGLNRLDWLNRSANLGYWIRNSSHGRGIATAATRLVLRFGIEVLGLQRVEIVTAKGNESSQRVAEKAGAVREALARNRCRVAGVQQDAYIYSVIPSDFVAAASSRRS
jgi:RimJ/RimL family protein N-acetyltransferase